jgi:hypothetical protein
LEEETGLDVSPKFEAIWMVQGIVDHRRARDG